MAILIGYFFLCVIHPMLAAEPPQVLWEQRRLEWQAQLQNPEFRKTLAKQLNFPADYLDDIYFSNLPKWPQERDYFPSKVDSEGIKWIRVSTDPYFCPRASGIIYEAPDSWAEEQIDSSNQMFSRLKIPIQLYRENNLNDTGGVVLVKTNDISKACSSDRANACSGYNHQTDISCEIYSEISAWTHFLMPRQKQHLLEHEGGHTFAQEHTDKIAGLPKDPRIKRDASLHTVMNSQPTWVESYITAPSRIIIRQPMQGTRGPLDEVQSLLYYGIAGNLTDLPQFRIHSPEYEMIKNGFFHAFLPELTSYFIAGFMAHTPFSARTQVVSTKTLSFFSRLFLMEPWKGIINFFLGAFPLHTVQELAVPIAHLGDLHYFPISKAIEVRYYLSSLGFNLAFELAGVLLGAHLGRSLTKIFSWHTESYFLSKPWQENLYQVVQTNYIQKYSQRLPRCSAFFSCFAPIIALDRAAAAWILKAKAKLGITSLRWYEQLRNGVSEGIRTLDPQDHNLML